MITDPKPLSETEVRKWTTYIVILALIAAAFSFVIYAWLLYQEKVHDENIDKTGIPNSDTFQYGGSGTDTNGVEAPSTAPITNSN